MPGCYLSTRAAPPRLFGGQRAGTVEARGTCVAAAPGLFGWDSVGNQECRSTRGRDD